VPLLKVWKHPRKKAYTENKYIHINRLKRDALKAFNKKMKAVYLKQLQDDHRKNGPFENFRDVISFIHRNERSLSKLENMRINKQYTRYKIALPISIRLIRAIRTIKAVYNDTGNPLYAQVAVSNDRFWEVTGLRIILEHRVYLFGSEYEHSTSGWLLLPCSGRNKCNDIFKLVESKRLENEQNVIYERLNGDMDYQQDYSIELDDNELHYLKTSLLDHIYEDKPLTYDTLGKQVVLISDTSILVVVLMSFTDDIVTICHGNQAMSVPRNNIKNILN
jgi:hypothetical protein